MANSSDEARSHDANPVHHDHHAMHDHADTTHTDHLQMHESPAASFEDAAEHAAHDTDYRASELLKPTPQPEPVEHAAHAAHFLLHC